MFGMVEQKGENGMWEGREWKFGMWISMWKCGKVRRGCGKVCR